VLHDALVLPVAERSEGRLAEPAPGVEVIRVSTLNRLAQTQRTTAEAFGMRQLDTEADLQALLTQLVIPDTRVSRFLALVDGKPAGAGGLNWFPALSMGLLWGGCTAEGARNRGVYTALTRARVDHARSLGATHVGVYARTSTSAPILHRRGFEQVGAMTSWRLGAEPEAPPRSGC
jgi:GNAT superfamily N-acetyltransferase